MKTFISISRSWLLSEEVRVLTRTEPVRRVMASISRGWPHQSRRTSSPPGSLSPWATSGSRWAGSWILWPSLNSGEKLTTYFGSFFSANLLNEKGRHQPIRLIFLADHSCKVVVRHFLCLTPHASRIYQDIQILNLFSISTFCSSHIIRQMVNYSL